MRGSLFAHALAFCLSAACGATTALDDGNGSGGGGPGGGGPGGTTTGADAAPGPGGTTADEGGGADGFAEIGHDGAIGDTGQQPQRDVASADIRETGIGDAPVANHCLTDDILDTGEVYLAGTLSEGACYRDALAHWNCPNVAAVGFDCYFDGNVSNSSAQVRPTDGRLLYLNTFEGLIREFHCDGCPYQAGAPYPAAPLANDTLLAVPCPVDSTWPKFLVSPTGSVLFYCVDTSTWRDSAGTVVYAGESGDRLRHLGYANQGLTQANVIDLSSGRSAAIVGLPTRPVLAIRARQTDGFWLALQGTTTNINSGLNDELWQVDGNGIAVRAGQFPPPPAYAGYLYAQAQLESSGALVQFGEGPAVFEDIIIRRDIGGTSQVVYTEASNPLVKIHISGLLTGP